MKFQIFIVFISLSLLSCKSESKSDTIQSQPISITEKIAKAHGYDLWEKVTQIDFTFNVDRDSSHYERKWSWKPIESQITMISATDSITYNTSKIDSISQRADQAFVNDKFWLLIPFQLVWDKTIEVTETPNALAPLSNKSMDMITITYPQEGGYTPGDAYDIYYDKDYLIREWVYRKGNSEAPSLINSFENYKDFNGLKLATEHKQANTNWNLNFTDIKVILN